MVPHGNSVMPMIHPFRTQKPNDCESTIGIKLKADWPDYVFHRDYALLPLGDLENFIDQNRRLPEMPTAEEVKEEGVKAGETLRLLTQKVEELMLYILQQQKEMEKQQKEIEALKTQLKTEKQTKDESK